MDAVDSPENILPTTADAEANSSNQDVLPQIPLIQKAAPQASTTDSDVTASSPVPDGLEDCHLTPLAVQQASLRDTLATGSLRRPPFLRTALQAVRSATANFGQTNSPAADSDQPPSSLHAEERSANGERHDPAQYESALQSLDDATTSSLFHKFKRRNPTAQRRNQSRLGPGRNAHSHPRKSPFKTEIARIRHQKMESSRTESDTVVAGLASTTAPPETASFVKQSQKFKEALLTSLTEFLTSAFEDNEESSASYFSIDLLEQLAHNDPSLKGVWLQAKGLRDEHVKQLCESLLCNKVVTEVWLPNNRITDEGAAYLAHLLKFNKTIKELLLGENDIGPKGAAALASALARGNTTLKTLGLGDNHIGIEGAGALAAALRHNHTLCTLDIKNNGIPKHSSIRGLLNKMLDFNTSDPGEESLVLGLQAELNGLISSLPPDMAEEVVLQAEEALKTAMNCRKSGDLVGAAEAEGVFIRICTTGEGPVDPPEERMEDNGGSEMQYGKRKNFAKKDASKPRSEKMNDDIVDSSINESHGTVDSDIFQKANIEQQMQKDDTSINVGTNATLNPTASTEFEDVDDINVSHAQEERDESTNYDEEKDEETIGTELEEFIAQENLKEEKCIEFGIEEEKLAEGGIITSDGVSKNDIQTENTSPQENS